MAIEIVSFPIQNGDFPWLCKRLPGRVCWFTARNSLFRWENSPRQGTSRVTKGDAMPTKPITWGARTGASGHGHGYGKYMENMDEHPIFHHNMIINNLPSGYD